MGNLSLNLITFPLWWYTTGWQIIWRWNKQQIFFGVHETGIFLFARHFKEPLYGDYTKSGRLLGFFFRFILLILKSVLLFLRIILLVIADAAYFGILPLILSLIIYELIP